MSTSSGGLPERTAAMDSRIGDRAVALLRELDAWKTDEPEVAPLASRFVARSIDLAFVSLLLFWVLVGVGLAVILKRGERPSPADPRPVEYVTFLLCLLGSLMAVEMAAVLRWRQSLGKKLMGLRVTGADGVAAVSRRRILVRTLLWAVPLMLAGSLPAAPALGWAVTVALLIAAMATLADRERRAPYDRLLGVRVMASALAMDGALRETPGHGEPDLREARRHRRPDDEPAGAVERYQPWDAPRVAAVLR